MNRKLFRIIEKHLYFQKQIELAVAEARADQQSNKGHIEGGGGRTFISDPTAQAAIKLATPLKLVEVPGMGTVYFPEDWITVLEASYAAQGEKKRQLLRRRYYRHNASAIRLGIDYGMSTKSVYNVCTEFVTDIALRILSKGVMHYG